MKNCELLIQPWIERMPSSNTILVNFFLKWWFENQLLLFEYFCHQISFSHFNDFLFITFLMSDIGLLVSVQCTSDIYLHQMKNLGGSIKPAQFHSVKWSTLKAKTRSFMRFESHALREIPSCHIWSFNCWSFCIWPYQIEIETAYTYLHTHTSSYACTGPTWMYGCKCVIRDGSQEMEWDCNGNAYLLFVPQMGSPSRKLTHVDQAENNEKRCGKAVTWATHFVSQQIALNRIHFNKLYMSASVYTSNSCAWWTMSLEVKYNYNDHKNWHH